MSKSSVITDNMLDDLDKRLHHIERQIFGKAPEEGEYPKLLDSINSLNSLVNTTASGKSNLESLFKRVTELDQDLELDHIEQQVLSMETKLDLILPMKNLLLEQASALEKIESMMDVLGSEHIKVVPGLQNNLYSLTKLHIQQEEEAGQLSEETIDLITKYNSLIEQMSSLFLRWTSNVCELESLAQDSEGQTEEA